MGSAGTVDVDVRANTSSLVSQVMGPIRTVAAQMSKTLGAIGAKVDKSLTKPLKQSAMAGSKTYGWLKDIGRIVQGIFISQILYRGILQPLQQAVQAAWQFQVQMEQTYLALELMLGGLGEATMFLRELESFAAVTPFQMGDVALNTRQLLGYGFAASEVLPVLEALSDASAIIGVSPEKMTQLVATLGKIKAQGRMMSRQVISFGAAGIPIFQILREELGLTQEEIRKIGFQAESQANIVLPAILRGLERKFGGASERAARTLQGLVSTIQDDLLLISKDLFGGVYETYRLFIAGITDRLEELRDVIVNLGVGGLFEEIVPERYQESVRQIIAHLIIFGRSLVDLWRALAPLRKVLFDIFITLMGAVVPILNLAATAIARFAQWVFYSDSVLARFAIALLTALSIMKAWTIVLSIAHALSKLAAMVGLAATAMNKWGLVILLVLGALVALAMSIPKVRTAIQGLWDQLMGFFGLDTSSLLQPIEVEDVMDTDALDEQLHTISEGAQQVTKDFKETEEQIKDTKKALNKYVLAFDEVYAIPEKYDKLEIPDIGKIDIPEVTGMDIDPEMEWPDWTEPAEKDLGEIGDLFDNLGDKILGTLKKIGTFIKEWAKIWWATVKELWGILWQFVKDFAGAFVQYFKEMWAAAKQFVGEIWGAYKQLFIDLVQGLWTFVKDIWAAIADFGKGLWEAFSTFIKEILAAVKNLVINLWEAIKQFWRELLSASSWDDVKQAFINLWNNILAGFGQFGEEISAAWNKLVERVKELATKFGEAISAAWNKWMENIRNAFTDFHKNILMAINNLQENVKNAYTNLIKNLTQAYKDFFINTFQAIFNYYYKIGELIANLFPGFYEMVKPYALKIVNFLLDAIMNMGSKITGVFTNLGSKIKNIMDSIINFIKNMVNTAISLINKIPGINIPTIKIGGVTGGVGVGRVPGMATGGIVGREQLVVAGENNIPEAYTPLTAQAIKPWADAIVGAMGGNTSGNQSTQEPGYVAVPIDSKGMVDLERKLFVIRTRENIRKGIGVTV